MSDRNCVRCDEPTKHLLCDRCFADEIADHECDDDYGEGPEFAFDCGKMPDGTCMLAGSEECDWECPHRG